jgi:apolipoprotein N-acyltransferase
MARRRDLPAGAAALGAGVLVAASLPPWGWWPLAVVGIAVHDRLVADRPWRARFARTWLFGVAWLAPGMGWMWTFSSPGYVVAVAAYAGYLGAAAAVAPAGRWRWLGLPGALTLAEAVRFSFPFGGVPLASLAISQSAGPLLALAPVVGALGMTWATFALGGAVSALARRRPSWRPAAATVAAVVVVAAAGLAVDTHVVGSARVAFVQGGGEQGTRAIDTPKRLVFERHVAASADVPAGVDLVVWPENVIVPTCDPGAVVDGDCLFSNSRELPEVAALAARTGAPYAVGVTEDEGRDHFTNAQVVVDPDGTQPGRYDKVRRVPFGEYVPLRGLVEALGAPTDRLVPRDATPGTGPAIVSVPGIGPVGVVISWEVFFGGRARDGIGHGGRLLLNPTNGASYTGTILQTQQVASSRLRARETGRWVVQASPTGFSAFVAPDGTVLDRTGQRERTVRVRTVELREGETPYVRFGDRPVIALAAVALGAAIALTRRARPRVGAALVAVAALLAGCSSSHDSAPVVAPTPEVPTSAPATSATTPSATTGAASSAPADAVGRFRTDGARIVAPDGRTFVPFGVNVNGYRWVKPGSTVADLGSIVDCWGFDLVRVNNVVAADWSSRGLRHYHDNDDLDAIVQAFTARKVVVVLEAHDAVQAAQDGTLGPIEAWLRDLAGRYRDNPYVWFDVANEPVQRGRDWVTLMTRLGRVVRDAGNPNPLVVNGAAFGQDTRRGGPVDATTSAVLAGGADVVAALAPVVFSVHVYEQWEGDTATRFGRYVDGVRRLAPLVVGEYGAFNNRATLDASRAAVGVAHDRGVGTVAWTWRGDPNNALVAGGRSGAEIDACASPTNLSPLGALVWSQRPA